MPSTPTVPPGEPARPDADLDRTQRVEALSGTGGSQRRVRRPPPPLPSAPPARRPLPWAVLFATALLFLAAALGALCLYLASAAREAERRAAALDDELITVRRLLTEAEARVEAAAVDRDAARAAAGRGATPRAAATLIELGAESAIGEGGALEIEVDLGPQRPPVVLALRPGRRPVEAGYRAEIVDVRGERVWRSEPLRREAGGRFVIVLPGGSLGRGRHELRLLGGRVGEERVLVAWYLQVVAGS